MVRLELGPTLLEELPAARAEVVFPIAHGPLGEDGCLQGLCEIMAIPYVGSAVAASALAADKLYAKQMFRAAGLWVATDVVVHQKEPRREALRRIRTTLGSSLVVKPVSQGSTVGVTLLGAQADQAALEQALELAFTFEDRVLCERFVAGREVTCGVLDLPELGGRRALLPVEIETVRGDFYDFTAKYAAKGSRHTCPPALPEEVIKGIRVAATKAHGALGCRDFSRADFIVEPHGQAILLEVNTLPGLTPTSLLPDACAVEGITMIRLCDALVKTALGRAPRPQVSAFPLPG